MNINNLNPKVCQTRVMAFTSFNLLTTSPTVWQMSSINSGVSNVLKTEQIKSFLLTLEGIEKTILMVWYLKEKFGFYSFHVVYRMK